MYNAWYQSSLWPHNKAMLGLSKYNEGAKLRLRVHILLCTSDGYQNLIVY